MTPDRLHRRTGEPWAIFPKGHESRQGDESHRSQDSREGHISRRTRSRDSGPVWIPVPPELQVPSPNGLSAQFRSLILGITGSLIRNIEVIYPAFGKQ